jgi:hypothetical protein
MSGKEFFQQEYRFLFPVQLALLRTRVLPVPTGASTRIAPLIWLMIFCCSELGVY